MQDLQSRGLKKLAEENSKPWILLFAKSEMSQEGQEKKSANISPVLFFNVTHVTQVIEALLV